MPDRHDADRSLPVDEPHHEVDLERLRRLLGVADAEDVREILTRLDDPEVRARDLSNILADAVMLSARQGDKLGNALEPAVQRAVHAAIRRDPRPFAGALYPAMAPAIRRAIAETLRGMVQSLNEMLEHSLSVRSLRWRWQAWRSKRSFAEVVLSHSLVFRVEQVFLIHRETGLLLQHVVDRTAEAQDPDLVSSMLTAIQDFVHDSFAVADGAALEDFRVGDLAVWLVQGRDAVLAVAIRGNAPESLRADLREQLRAVHLRFFDELGAFEGDSGPFEAAREPLQSCLVSRYRQSSSRTPFFSWLALTAVVAAIVIWAVVWYRGQQRWQTFRDNLEAAPGIVVTAVERVDGGRLIRGLRDPLADDPETIAAESDIDEESFSSSWEPFTSLEPSLVLRRATSVLDPPPGISLGLEDGVLVATGTAPEDWLARARRLARSSPGVLSFRHSGRASAPGPKLMELARRAESRLMRFPSLGTELITEDAAVVEALAADVQGLFASAEAEGWKTKITLIGHADATGREELNIELSRKRAETVEAALSELGIPADRITVMGVGSSQPIASEGGDPVGDVNRRVDVRIEFVAANREAG